MQKELLARKQYNQRVYESWLREDASRKKKEPSAAKRSLEQELEAFMILEEQRRQENARAFKEWKQLKRQEPVIEASRTFAARRRQVVTHTMLAPAAAQALERGWNSDTRTQEMIDKAAKA